ncbi:MAG: sensor histidine kinase [Cyanomargarita calcarea GSE-NOS-MK-12-04C]|uniref:histidine kinase n=1 Tax=Cyanomargarita calcarea GSE-NOS-MK-12-04C TaxID=2839659 RepID=A0A951QGY3_9CYAN|nr:sensor histidine kinase [Cyanomargarita calcarea GSE-NOS-MK-12-04C]
MPMPNWRNSIKSSPALSLLPPTNFAIHSISSSTLPRCSNDFSNAIKYSPQDSVVYFELQYQNGNAIFRIEDTGIGIPINDQERLFESFHRASNAKEISGTGLGLAIVKQCVDLHGGQISVESQVGVGTKFTVIIPASQDAAQRQL